MAGSQVSQGGKNKLGRKERQISGLLTYSTDKNMCKGVIECQDEFGMVKRQPALFMNASYFNNLRKYATEEDKEIAELNRNERLKDLKNSKALSKDWWDTPENLRRTKEEKKLKQKKKYEEDSERIFREMEIANRETDRTTVANAKVLKFKERPDVKEFLGACLLAEVLNEQAAQINFNEKIKRQKEEREKKYHEDEMKINYVFLQKEAEKMTEKRKVNLKYGKELLEQINSRHKLELEEEQERKERERNFFASLSKMKNDDSKERRMEEYIQSLKNEELTNKVFKEERQRDNEMEDNHIKDYKESVFKLNEAMRKRKDEKRIASEAKSEAAVATLNFFRESILGREAKERENMERDMKRLAEKQEQRALDDERRRKKIAADFLAANVEQRKKEESKKEEISLMKNYERLREMKLDDDCKQAKEEKQVRMKVNQELTRIVLKEQIDLKATKEEKEREEMEKYRAEKKGIQRKEDEEFSMYAEALVDRSKSNGRDIRAMEKLLKKFYERQKIENL